MTFELTRKIHERLDHSQELIHQHHVHFIKWSTFGGLCKRIRSIYLVDFALFVKGKITNFTRLANTFKNKCLDLKFIDGLILNVIYNLF